MMGFIGYSKSPMFVTTEKSAGFSCRLKLSNLINAKWMLHAGSMFLKHRQVTRDDTKQFMCKSANQDSGKGLDYHCQ